MQKDGKSNSAKETNKMKTGTGHTRGKGVERRKLREGEKEERKSCKKKFNLLHAARSDTIKDGVFI